MNKLDNFLDYHNFQITTEKLRWYNCYQKYLLNLFFFARKSVLFQRIICLQVTGAVCSEKRPIYIHLKSWGKVVQEEDPVLNLIFD